MARVRTVTSQSSTMGFRVSAGDRPVIYAGNYSYCTSLLQYTTRSGSYGEVGYPSGCQSGSTVLVIFVMDDVGGCIAIQSRISDVQGPIKPAQYLVEANELQQLMILRAIEAFVNVDVC